jgi:hypothetical protein
MQGSHTSSVDADVNGSYGSQSDLQLTDAEWPRAISRRVYQAVKKLTFGAWAIMSPLVYGLPSTRCLKCTDLGSRSSSSNQ